VEPGDLLFVGIRGFVLALNRQTGDIVWQQQLKGWNTPLLAYDDSRVYATVEGEVYCLSAENGARLWNNPLKGLGTGMCVLLAPGGFSSDAPPVLLERARQEAQRNTST
jgi:outer membrane protein assembly factor BamB